MNNRCWNCHRLDCNCDEQTMEAMDNDMRDDEINEKETEPCAE